MQRMANSVLERESRLKQNEAKLSSILEGAADAILITDRQGSCQYANSSATQLLGYEREQFFAMSILDLIPAQRHGNVDRKLKELVEKEPCAPNYGSSARMV